MCVTLWQLGFGGFWIFFFFFSAHAKELCDSCCKRALGRNSALAFLLLCSWQWPFAWIWSLVQAVLVLHSLKTDSNSTWVTKILFLLQAWAVWWTNWSLPVLQYFFWFKGVCLRDEQVLMSCLLWSSLLWGWVFFFYRNGDTIEISILKDWTKL